MDHPRELRLAGPRLARDEDRDVERRHELHLAEHPRQRRADPDDVVDAKAGPERRDRIDLTLPRADEEALDQGPQVSREGAGAIDFALRERPAGAAALEVEDADGRALHDRHAKDRLDLRGLHARTVAEPRIQDRRRAHDRLAQRQRLLDDAPRHDRANELDLLVRAPRGAPPRRPLVRVEDLEIALIRAEDVDDEAEGLVEERLRVLSIAQAQKADVEIPLLAEPLVVAVVGAAGHVPPCETPRG